MARNFGMTKPDTGWDTDDWDTSVIGKDYIVEVKTSEIRHIKILYFLLGCVFTFLVLWGMGTYVGL